MLICSGVCKLNEKEELMKAYSAEEGMLENAEEEKKADHL